MFCLFSGREAHVSGPPPCLHDQHCHDAANGETDLLVSRPRDATRRSPPWVLASLVVIPQNRLAWPLPSCSVWSSTASPPKPLSTWARTQSHGATCSSQLKPLQPSLTWWSSSYWMRCTAPWHDGSLCSVSQHDGLVFLSTTVRRCLAFWVARCSSASCVHGSTKS